MVRLILTVFVASFCLSEVFLQKNFDKFAGFVGKEKDNKYDPYYRALAEEALSRLPNKGRVYVLSSIDKVSVRIVSGTITKINFNAIDDQASVINCTSFTYDQPKNDEKIVLIECKEIHYPLSGPTVERDPRNSFYGALAQISLNRIASREDQTLPKPNVLTVEKVLVSVVAGIVYRIDFTASQVNGDARVHYCHSDILNQEWVNKQEIKVNCRIPRD